MRNAPRGSIGKSKLGPFGDLGYTDIFNGGPYDDLGYTFTIKANHTPVKNNNKYDFTNLHNDIMINKYMLKILNELKYDHEMFLEHFQGRETICLYGRIKDNSKDSSKYKKYFYIPFNDIVFNTLLNRFKLCRYHPVSILKIKKLYALYYKFFTHTKLQSKPISEFYAYLKDQLKDVPVPPSRTQKTISWLTSKMKKQKKSNTKTINPSQNINLTKKKKISSSTSNNKTSKNVEVKTPWYKKIGDKVLSYGKRKKVKNV